MFHRENIIFENVLISIIYDAVDNNPAMDQSLPNKYWLTHWGRDKIDAISQTTF